MPVLYQVEDSTWCWWLGLSLEGVQVSRKERHDSALMEYSRVCMHVTVTVYMYKFATCIIL